MDRVFALATRRLYLCVPRARRHGDVPAGGACAGVSTSSNCAKRTSTSSRAAPLRASHGADLSGLRRPLHRERLPRTRRRRSAPTACTSAKTTSAWRGVASCSVTTRSWGSRRTRPTEFDARAQSDGARYFSAGPIVADADQAGSSRNRARLRRRQPGAQRSPGLRHRWRERTTTSLRLVAAGLRHFVVVRALTESPRPRGSGARHAVRRSMRRSQRWRSSQPKSVATIRGSARS